MTIISQKKCRISHTNIFFHDHTYLFRYQCHFESWHEILEFAKYGAHWECLVHLINKAESHLNRSSKKKLTWTKAGQDKTKKNSTNEVNIASFNVNRQSLQATEKRVVLQWAMTISIIANRLVSESKMK